MARYLTTGLVVLADDHPHTQGTLDAARAFAGKRYAVGHDGGSRFGGFDDVVDPGRGEPTVAATFKEAARRNVPWVAVRRDLAPPPDLLGQLMEATARRTSKELPGFIVLLTAPEKRKVRRILAIVDRSDGQPSGLMVLAAVAAAEQTGAAVDVLVIGAPNEELDSSAPPKEVLRVSRDRDLFEQAQRRSESLGARGNWMFVDHVESRIQLVRDVLASRDYDLIVDDLGDVNLGGRMGRHKRISRALHKNGPAGITMAVLKKTDVPVLLVLDAVRLGLVPARVKAGAGAGVLVLGVMASAAPAAASGPVERAQYRTSISQTVDSYDDALTAASSLEAASSVEAAHEQARASADEAQATETVDEQAAQADQSAEQQADEQQSDEQSTEESKADEAAPDEQAAEAGEEAAEEVVAPSEMAPEDVTPEEAPTVDPEDVAIPEDLSRSDVEKAQEAAADSKDDLKKAQSQFDKAQEAAVEAKDETVEASESATEAAGTLAEADAAYEQAADEADDAISSATGVSAALPGAATADEVAAAEAQQSVALADLEAATTQADEALDEYQETATDASEASADLDAAAGKVTEAQTQYNEDKATAEAYQDAYEAKMADARVSPVAEGEYTATGHYGDAGEHWSTGYHTGEDYAAPVGTEVVAAASGTVVEVTYGDPAYGNRIVIEHEDGYYTTYNHLSTVDVAVGDQVLAGDAIGEVGNTGNSTGAHLHFEVTHNGDGWTGGEFVDPHAWLDGDVG